MDGCMDRWIEGGIKTDSDWIEGGIKTDSDDFELKKAGFDCPKSGTGKRH